MIEANAQLFKVISSEDVKALETMLQEGFSPNVMDESGNTPLLLAAQMGSVACTRVLLDYGADANATNLSGFTPLYYAILNQHNQTVRFLLEEGALVNPQAPGDDTAILLASSKGFKPIVEMLLERPINRWAVNQFGSSALHNAAAGGYTSIIEVLLKGEKNMIATTKLAYKRFIVLWNSITIPDEALPYEALKNANDIIKEQAGGVNSIDFKKRTALHYAAKGGFYDTVVYLISQGAVASISDKFGNTPLIFAKNANNAQLVTILRAQEEKEG